MQDSMAHGSACKCQPNSFAFVAGGFVQRFPFHEIPSPPRRPTFVAARSFIRKPDQHEASKYNFSSSLKRSMKIKHRVHIEQPPTYGFPSFLKKKKSKNAKKEGKNKTKAIEVPQSRHKVHKNKSCPLRAFGLTNVFNTFLLCAYLAVLICRDLR